jgi:hypothetical protein
MENNGMNGPKKAFTQWGLPLGLLNAAIYGLVYALNTQLLVSLWLGLGLIVLNGGVFIWALVQTRKSLGGYAEFRDLWGVWLGAALGLVLVTTAFNALLYKVIDPTLSEQVQVMAQEKAVEMMESMGTPQEDVDKALARMEQQKGEDPFSPLRLLMSFFGSLLVHVVLGAIFAAIFKKNKPLFAPSDEA